MTLINSNLLQPALSRANDSSWRRRGLVTGPGGGVTSPAAAIIAAMSPTPNSARQELITSTYSALVSAGAYTSADVMYFQAAAAQQPSTVDWVTPSKLLVNAGSPVFTADSYQAYDGTAGQYANTPSTYTANLTSAITLPQGPNGPANNGFTCTGLYKDATDGPWWVGNFGGFSFSAPGATRPGVVHMSADFSTILSVFDFNTIYGAGFGESPQGVCIDNNENVCVACPSKNTVNILTKAGVAVSTIPFSGINGLTFDTLLNLYIGCADSGLGATSTTIKWFNSSGTTIQTKVVAGWIDNLFFDGSEGAQGVLYYTLGPDGGPPCVCGKIDVATNAYLGTWYLPTSLAIEGCWYDAPSQTLTLMNDGFFHNGALNQALIYNASPLGTNLSSRIQLCGTVDVTSVPAGTEVIVYGDDPIFGCGIGLFVLTAGAQVRMQITTTPAAAIDVTWTVATASRFSYWLDINLTAKTAALYINGTLVSSQAITGVGANMPKLSWAFGAATGQAVSRNCAMQHSNFTAMRGATVSRTATEAANSAYFTALGLTFP